MIESVRIRNPDTLQEVVIDKFRSKWVLDEADLGTVEGTHHSYRYVSQVGVYIDSTALEQRIVAISGWVIGATYEEILASKSILNQLVNPLYFLDIHILENRYKLEFKPDYSIQYSPAYEENNEVLCRFLIQGTCANPMYQNTHPIHSPVASTIPKFRFPLIIPKATGIIMGLRNPLLIALLFNAGDIPTGMQVQFSCTSPVENPKLYHIDTQEFIRINKTILPGEVVTVSTVSGSKFVRGTYRGVESNYFGYWDFDSTWIQLTKGDNPFRYDADAGMDGLDVLITFNPQYLEVQ